MSHAPRVHALHLGRPLAYTTLVHARLTQGLPPAHHHSPLAHSPRTTRTMQVHMGTTPLPLPLPLTLPLPLPLPLPLALSLGGGAAGAAVHHTALRPAGLRLAAARRAGEG